MRVLITADKNITVINNYKHPISGGSRGLMNRVGLVTRRSQVRVSGPAGIGGGSE